MARRNAGLLETLVEMPWWVSIAAAVVVYGAARWLLPWVAGEQAIGKSLGTISVVVAPYLALLFLIPAPFAVWREWRNGRTLASTADWGAVQGLSWQEFETLLGTAYRRLGYEVEARGGAGADGGIDLILRESRKTTLVQCKHWDRRQVGVGVVRELYGVMNSEAVEAGIIVTSGSFTADASAFARNKPIELVDGAGLRKLLSYARAGG